MGCEGRARRWVEWFISGDQEKPVSPYTALSQNEHALLLSREGDLHDQWRGIQTSPKDGRFYARAAWLLASDPQRDKLSDEAIAVWDASVRYYAHSALELSPESSEVHALQAAIFH